VLDERISNSRGAIDLALQRHRKELFDFLRSEPRHLCRHLRCDIAELG